MATLQSFIQELIARADVVESVGRYVQLKKGSANFMGLRPFHGESRHPSRSARPNSSATALGAERTAMPSAF
jgi:DNA primase